MEMVGHTSLVYSVAAHSSGLVASGSEDRFLKIWKGHFSFKKMIPYFNQESSLLSHWPELSGEDLVKC
jgi:hypothetical protein